MSTITIQRTGRYTSSAISDITSGTATLYAMPVVAGQGPAERVLTPLGVFTPAEQEIELTEASLAADTWYEFLAVGADAGVSNVIRHALRKDESHFSVDLTVSRTEENVPGRSVAFRVAIAATDAQNFGNDIFLYDRRPYCDDDTLERDVFIAVCKPADLEFYPVGAPGNTDKPYFRKDSVDLMFKSLRELDETVDLIQSDVKLLTDGLEILRTLSPSSITTVAGNPTE